MIRFIACSSGRYDKAEPLYLQCVHGMKSQLGPNHPTTLSFMNNLAGLYCSQGTSQSHAVLHFNGVEFLAHICINVWHIFLLRNVHVHDLWRCHVMKIKIFVIFIYIICRDGMPSVHIAPFCCFRVKHNEI